MASRIVVERLNLKTLRQYHHGTMNVFGENETLVNVISARPGFFGPSPIAYLSLIARRKETRLKDLEEALINDRSLVRASAFRNSLFILNTSDYAIYYRAIYPVLKLSLMEKLRANGINDSLLENYSKRLRESQFHKPLDASELEKILFDGSKKKEEPDLRRMILRKLCDLGVLIRASNKGWKGNAYTYALLENWLPDLRLRPDNPESARTETIRKYLKCYGPATIEDMSWWTGLAPIQIHRSILHLKREAVRFLAEGYKEELFGLKEMVDNIRSPKPIRSAILFLPPWDPYTLGWKNRKRLVDKEWLPWVYDQFNNAASIIIHDGGAVGLWQFRDSKVNVFEYHVFESFRGMRTKIIQAAEEFALSVAKLSGANQINMLERTLPKPLKKRRPGSFLWPLGKELPFYSNDSARYNNLMDRRSSNKYRGTYLDNKFLVRPPQGSPLDIA